MDELFKQVGSSIPNWAAVVILVMVGLLGAPAFFSDFLQRRKVSSLGSSLIFAVFLIAGIALARDRYNSGKPTQSNEEAARDTSVPAKPATNDQNQIDERRIEQDLQKRAISAAKFVMDNMSKTVDFRSTTVVVRKAEVIRQPNNITVPYIGRVLLHVSDDRLDYTGQLNLNFEMQRSGWYLAEVTPSNYVAGPNGRSAEPGKIATVDALPTIRNTEAQWIVNWKAAYALGKTNDR